ncbi:MAG TPA: sulfurtransferase TusA family protein [Acetobacteraceae bacterium]|nr:sulfurtransferase TusA family protein [Acetobacteraceae bacterium]
MRKCKAADLAADHEIDITGDICPMTFVRTRLALDRLQPGQTLLVHLRGAEPRSNVPATAQDQGHAVLAIETDSDGVSHVLLRKGA